MVNVLKKSNINALHDDEIIDCPVAKKDSRFVYQIPLDNLKENGKHEDIRIPVIANEFPLVFLQYRSVDNRFSIAVDGELKPRHEVLSDAETDLIKKLCQAIGLEFGEIDAIRHQKDGKLYVIDINNTPSSRFRLFSKKAYKPFLDKQKDLFFKNYL
jgi:archaeosine-15-forming tRNA-guanine transglycosylase